MKYKIYFISGQTVEFETNQFNSLDTLVGELSEIESGYFINIDGVRAVAKDHVQFIELLDD